MLLWRQMYVAMERGDFSATARYSPLFQFLSTFLWRQMYVVMETNVCCYGNKGDQSGTATYSPLFQFLQLP